MIVLAVTDKADRANAAVIARTERVDDRPAAGALDEDGVNRMLIDDVKEKGRMVLNGDGGV